MKPFRLIFLLLIIHFKTFSQLKEDFTSNGFLENPHSQGDKEHFVINEQHQLQSNGPESSADIYLATPNNFLINTEWQFYVGYSFNPSSSNFAKVYLSSDSPNLKEICNGYYLRLGGMPGDRDAIELYRQEGDKSIKIIEGIPGNAGKDNNIIRIRVIRDKRGQWFLYSDTTGGTNFTLEGSGFDNNFLESNWCGLVYTHTVTRRSMFTFDDFIIQKAPFLLTEIVQENNKALRLSFTSQLERYCLNADNFYVPDIGHPKEVIPIPDTPLNLVLKFDQEFHPGSYNMILNNIVDTDGRLLKEPTSYSFQIIPHYSYGDIVITEIFPNPSPTIGLPEEEFAEIYNNTSTSINLLGFTFSDPSTTAILPEFNVMPGERVILTRSSAKQAFEAFGPTIGLSRWPVLNTSGDELWLKDGAGNLIFHLNYTSSWYKNDEKSRGGWSLEMKKITNLCIGEENWAASENQSGGTPGAENSWEDKPFVIPPFRISNVGIIAPSSIKIKFNRHPDTTTLLSHNFQLLYHNHLLTPFNNNGQINLQTDPPLEHNLPYHLSISGLFDCAGNPIKDTIINIVLPDHNDSLDIIINEVLFNPPAGAKEFIEIYNNSYKYLDLKNWEIANIRNGKIGVRRKISDRNLLIPPYSYRILTTSKELLHEFYPNTVRENVIELNSLPSIPNTSGTIIILDDKNKISDRFDYNEQFHFPLLENKRGVSLERVSFFAPTNISDNWHSASESAGFATPGFENSQASNFNTNKEFVIEPKVFSPDGDGYKDFTTIAYLLTNSGTMANIIIYDSYGRKVKEIARNSILGKEGFFQWDGTNDNLSKVNTGYYIIYIELSDLHGKVISYKETVAVGAKFK